MSDFFYKDGQLMAEGVPVTALAEKWGTPLYVYSKAALTRHWQAFDAAFSEREHLICFAVKANSNLAVLQLLAQLGSGFDVVSQGELERVLTAGGDPAKVVFSGVGKTAEEMVRALEVGIHCFNVESAPELELLNEVAARLGKVAPVSLRVNPDVDAGTHPYISTGLKENKFGIDIEQAPAVYRRAHALENISVQGVDVHIGSQLTEISPFIDALRRVLTLVDSLQNEGIDIAHLDLGGGLGVCYQDETPPDINAYGQAILAELKDRPQSLIFEPGRYIAANAGIFVTQVQFLKPTEHKNFCVVDGAMNDLIRPSLYSAWQGIANCRQDTGEEHQWDIVGPVCETGDFLGKDRTLAVAPGDYLAVFSAGAYGFVMASNYNSRGRPAEVLVDGDKDHLVRQRESLESLWQNEVLLERD